MRTTVKEVQFGFLNLANGSNIGFDTAATIAVSKSRHKERVIRKQEVGSLIQRRCREITSEAISAIRGFALAEDGLASAKNELERALLSLSVGKCHLE